MTRIKKGILTLISLSLVLIYCLINDPSRDITLTLGLYAGSSWDVPNGESYQVIDQAIKKFEKKYPNVHVEYKSGIIKDDYSSWLANEITKGTIPDAIRSAEYVFPTPDGPAIASLSLALDRCAFLNSIAMVISPLYRNSIESAAEDCLMRFLLPDSQMNC